MRRAALALLLTLSACATPTGVPTGLCDASIRSRDLEISEPGGVEERVVAIDCMRPIERRRLRIGFTMPGGPECLALSRIEVVESADAVSVTLFVARSDEPNTAACADEPQRVRTEFDLQQAPGQRTLLDGSLPSDQGPSASPDS